MSKHPACEHIASGRLANLFPHSASKPSCINVLFSCCSEECRQAVSERIAATQTDYRLDYGVGTSCQVRAA